MLAEVERAVAVGIRAVVLFPKVDDALKTASKRIHANLRQHVSIVLPEILDELAWDYGIEGVMLGRGILWGPHPTKSVFRSDPRFPALMALRAFLAKISGSIPFLLASETELFLVPSPFSALMVAFAGCRLRFPAVAPR